MIKAVNDNWISHSVYLFSTSSLVYQEVIQKSSCFMPTSYIIPHDSTPDFLVFDLPVLFLSGPLPKARPLTHAKESMYILTSVCFSLYTKQMNRNDASNFAHWEDFVSKPLKNMTIMQLPSNFGLHPHTGLT